MATICQGIFARGETPFLHVKTDNARAIQAYQRLGFIERVQMHLAVLRYAEDIHQH